MLSLALTAELKGFDRLPVKMTISLSVSRWLPQSCGMVP